MLVDLLTGLALLVHTRVGTAFMHMTKPSYLSVQQFEAEVTLNPFFHLSGENHGDQGCNLRPESSNAAGSIDKRWRTGADSIQLPGS